MGTLADLNRILNAAGGRKRQSRKGSKFVCAKLLFVCADSRFAEPRSFLKKVLIVAVRRCHCGELHRGLQNLGASCEGVRVVTFCIVQKVTKKHAGRSPATHDSKLCRNLLGRNLQRHVSKPVLPANRRRKGFESVRKGYRSADARLMFFEKREGILQAHSRLSRMKFAVAR